MIRTANLTGPVSRAAGGLYESVRRLVQELQLTGLEVAVMGSFDEFTMEDIGAWDPVMVRAFKPIGPQQFGFSFGYQEFLRLYRPSILHTHGIWIYSSIATHRYATRYRVPYMISPHGMLDPWAVRNAFWKKWIARYCYEDAHLRDAACIRALCDSEAQSIRKYGLTQPIAIIPNGVDLPEEDQTKPETGNLKPETAGSKTLLFLGRIHPKKGLANLIRAFARSRGARVEGRGPWRLVIAGWDQGGHEAELIQLCRELGMKVERRKLKDEGFGGRDLDPRPSIDGTHPRWAVPPQRGCLRQSSAPIPTGLVLDSEVIFHGPAFKEEKDSLLRSADAFVLPSFSEGLPMSVLEAWSYRLPVVMTPECNLPEGFAADAAIRVETDTESIARGLDALFSMSQGDLKAMGAKGRTLVEERFTWKSVAARMRGVYDWMLGGGEVPSSVMMGNG